MTEPLTLAILPALRATRCAKGRILLTRKFLDGVVEYQKYWPGRVRVLLEPRNDVDSNLDHVELSPADLPFALDLVEFGSSDLSHELARADIALVSAGFRTNNISRLCRSHGVPCVYLSEYSLKTRKQIVRVSTANPLIRMRRIWWEARQERKQRKAIRKADGIQCNGTPTFDDYRTINPDPLLYFDSRITETMLATERSVAKWAESLLDNRPLSLAFSGRLLAMKGVDHLALVAEELRKAGVPFQLAICGAGDMEDVIRRQIQDNGLQECVKLLGVLDFRSELIPFLKDHVDLFVCCHRQGDPSCTYLEVMSCGVPIAGYDNEAFQGIVRESKAGWGVPLDQPELLAKRIAGLSRNRGELKAGALRALRFAREHTFEKTFKRRTHHLERICQRKGETEKLR